MPDCPPAEALPERPAGGGGPGGGAGTPLPQALHAVPQLYQVLPPLVTQLYQVLLCVVPTLDRQEEIQ